MKRFCLWLSILALTSNALAQVLLGTSVVEATLEPPAPVHHHVPGMAMGPDMDMAMAGDHAGPMGGMAGHTHKGHSDCQICGSAAAISAYAAASVVLLTLAEVQRQNTIHALTFVPLSIGASAYFSRAPPPAIG